MSFPLLIASDVRSLRGTKCYKQQPVKKTIRYVIVVVRPSKKSKMTMPSDWRLAAVGPIMACETNPSPEDSPTYRTWAYGDCSAGGGCSSFKQGAFYLPHGPQWKLCYSKLGVVLGKRLLSIGVYSGLWEALLGSLWNFSSAPNREGYSTTLTSDVQLFLWGQRYWFENDLFFLFVFFYQSPSITLRKLEETSNQK